MITVAICTRNRCALLRQTLARMTELSVPDTVQWELLVVENNCTDETLDVVRGFEGRLPVRTASEPRAGLAWARNHCLDEARGDWIVFTDDDVLMGTDWLAEFASAVGRHPGAAVAGGPIEPWFPVEPPADLAEAYPELRQGFCGVNHDIPEGFVASEYSVFGANMAVRKSALDGMRFDTELGPGARLPLGEETELIGRVRSNGGGVLWIPSMRVRHYVDPHRMTLSYLRKYRRMWGTSQVRLYGWPKGPTLFGAPRWLWGTALESYAAFTVFKLIGRRHRSLVALRQYDFWRSMLRECRRMSAAQVAR